MSPDMPLRAALCGLRIELEAPVFLPTLRRGFHQRNRSIVFRKAVEHAVGISDCAFTERFLLRPNFLARLEILAHPSHAVGVAVEIAIYKNHSAMMVLHHFIGIKTGQGVVLSYLDRHAACSVPGGDINL